MRGETVAEGIKRRIAEKEQARRKHMKLAVDIAIWSGAIGCFTTMLGLLWMTYASGPH